LTLSDSEVVALIDSYEKESRAIKEEALKMTWFMRGGLSYEDAIMLSFREKEIIAKIVKDNMETTKESGLPFF
jgi:hypothetical protein